jgi:hypothetical protein
LDFHGTDLEQRRIRIRIRVLDIAKHTDVEDLIDLAEVQTFQKGLKTVKTLEKV